MLPVLKSPSKVLAKIPAKVAIKIYNLPSAFSPWLFSTMNEN